jgi:hypothetical protein
MGIVVGVFVGFGASILAMSAGVFDPKPPPETSSKEWGEFIGAPPRVELLEDGRSIRLLDDFAYVDTRSKVWVAKRDAVANGASIPKVFWSITGGPLSGRFRNASIIHDEACREMIEPSDAVHLAFYEACRCSGVPEKQAKTLYAAVYHFGPKWEVNRVFEMMESTNKVGKKIRLKIFRRIPKIMAEATEPGEDVVKKLEAYVESTNPSIAELRQLDPKEL